MNQVNRIGRGGRIERDKPIDFVFNGRRYCGYRGDTLASALLANGVSMVGRSWKYHRPRGIVSCGVEEPNAILQLEHGAHTIPNARATEVWEAVMAAGAQHVITLYGTETMHVLRAEKGFIIVGQDTDGSVIDPEGARQHVWTGLERQPAGAFRFAAPARTRIWRASGPAWRR